MSLKRSKRPRKEDRVRISGFLGEFEIVQVAEGGAMADLKHLGLRGPDYIEKEILAGELIYLDDMPFQSPARSCGR